MTIGRSVLVALLAASVILLAVVISWEPGTAPSEGPSSGIKVIVLGIDGADWYMLGRLMDEGRMTSLAALIRQSITGEVTADMPPVPDVGWTILGRGMELTDQEMSAAGAADGRLRGLPPELGELVAAAGGSALAVGWPASWPAAGGGEMLVTPFTSGAPVHGNGLPPTLYADGVAQTFPDTLDGRLASIVIRDEGLCESEFRRVVFAGDAIDDGWGDNLLAARWAFLSDLITVDTAAQLIASEQPDLALICLGGLDAVGHRFLAPATPEFFSESSPESERYSDVLVNYYGFIDRCIERIRRLTDEHTVFIVCSTYGTHPSADLAGLSGSHSNGPPGVLVARGPRMTPRPTPIELSTKDVAPTVLATLGVRIPTDLEGRLIPELVPQGLLREHPPTYSGRVEITAREPTAEELEVMRGLAEQRLEFLRSRM
jgi:hypothetical protein